MRAAVTDALGRALGWLLLDADRGLLLQPGHPPVPGAGGPDWRHFALQMLSREGHDCLDCGGPSEGWLRNLAGRSRGSVVIEETTSPLPADLPKPAAYFDYPGEDEVPPEAEPLGPEGDLTPGRHQGQAGPSLYSETGQGGSAAPAPAPAPAPKAEPFHSRLQKGLEGLGTKPVQAASVFNRVKKLGVPDEEWHAAQMPAALEGKQQVHPQELLQHFHANKVLPQEVWKGHDFQPEYQRYQELAQQGERAPHEQSELRRLSAMFAGGDTRYENYQTPGGNNYRELLLTSPSQSAAAQEKIAQLEAQQSRLGNSANYPDRRIPPEALEQLSALDKEINKQRAVANSDYKSSHWREPNVIAHARMHDRIGPNGEKVLHVEEVQSDWHQEGRKKGYKTPESNALMEQRQLLRRELHKAEDAAIGGSLEASTRAEDIRRRLGAVNDQIDEHGDKAWDGVPDGSYKDSWPTLAMKRLLYHAAEHGYDQLTLNSGKQIQSQVGGEEEGQHHFYDTVLPNVLGKLGKPFGVKPEQDRLPSEFQKAKILPASEAIERFPDQWGQLSGDGYVALDPETGRSLLGVYGSNLPTLESARVALDSAHRTNAVPVTSLKITPEMRRSILATGYPHMEEGGVAPGGPTVLQPGEVVHPAPWQVPLVPGSRPDRDSVVAPLHPGDQVQPVQRQPAAYARADLRPRLEAAVQRVDPEPTPAQREAGNYRKGHVTVHGIPITIENAQGSIRSGQDKSGKPWSTVMAHHYGYVKQTEGDTADKDHLDIFVGPHVESELVFIVDQIKPGGKFDEHKCLLGFRNESEARKGYLDCYAPGWQGLGDITHMTLPQFKAWIDKGKLARPVAQQVKYERGEGEPELPRPTLPGTHPAAQPPIEASPTPVLPPTVKPLEKAAPTPPRSQLPVASPPPVVKQTPSSARKPVEQAPARPAAPPTPPPPPPEPAAPRTPEQEREAIYASLSANPNDQIPGRPGLKLPGLRKLNDQASAGDLQAGHLLSNIAHDALTYLTGGIPGVKVESTPALGLYGGDLEASLGTRISFPPEHRAAALAALAKFADNFDQHQIHVRSKPEPDTPVGHQYGDGSYNTGVIRLKLAAPLERQEVEEVIKASGLYGLTATPKHLEAYYVGDPADAASIRDWTRKVEHADQLLGSRATGIDREIARLWAYGHGDGIPYERIAGDVRTAPPHDNPAARRIAARLAGRNVQGWPSEPHLTLKQENLQREISDAYDRMRVDGLHDPVVHKAYQELAHEVRDQYEALPVKVEIWKEDGQPYKDSKAMRQDVLSNNHLYIYGTEPDHYGPEGKTFENHPLLADSGLKDINGRPLLDNDLLRAVHDYYAHTLSPVQFGPLGEEAAWRNHMAMTRSPLARWALTSETRGQNSWVNFGKHGDFNRANPAKTIFADQKTDLLPLRYAMTGDPRLDQELLDAAQAAGHQRREAEHYSRAAADDWQREVSVWTA